MALSEILQWISISRKTGTLELERGSIQKKVLFQEGCIHSSWSNDPRESLGQFLIRARKVTEEQLFKALLLQEEKNRPLGAILIEGGLIDEQGLRQSLCAKAEETIHDLFLWPEGRFEFKEGPPAIEYPIHVELQVQAVILEGIRRVDEWARIRQAFPSLSTTFKTLESPEEVSDPDERQALDLAAAGKTLSEIALEMRRSEFEAAALLFDLHRRGVVEASSTASAAAAADPVGAIRDLLGLAYQRMHERRFDAAAKAYQQVLSLDRLNQHAKKGLLTASEARNRERVARSVPLAMVPHLTVDFATLTQQNFDPQEGFVLSRVNGQWDVQSILKLCPMAEADALQIFAHLLERKVIELREP